MNRDEILAALDGWGIDDGRTWSDLFAIAALIVALGVLRSTSVDPALAAGRIGSALGDRGYYIAQGMSRVGAENQEGFPPEREIDT